MKQNRELRHYHIDRNDRVVIYGAGALGKAMAVELKKEWNIVALFDQNADNIVQDIDVPIYTLKEGISLLGSEITVIICIHNACLHASIAKNISMMGINRIIFAPVGKQFVSEYKDQMQEVYAHLFEKNIRSIEMVPYYDEMEICRWSKCIIRETQDIVVAWCNFEVLYISHSGLESERKKGIPLDKYIDLPVAAYRTLIEGYKYFQDGMSSIEEFVDSYKLRESANHNIKAFLQRRYAVYQMLENEWKTNQQYFEYAPVDVEWNQKGYFNITDGHNRAVYLHLKGLNWIPVRMSRTDYIAWENESVANRVIQGLEQEKIDAFITPIPHPYFMYEEVQKEVNGLEILSAFQYYLGVEIRNVKTVLEIGEYEGYFSRNFIRSGAQEAVVIESDEAVKRRILEMQDLLQLSSIRIKNDLTDCDSNMDIDIAFIVSGMESDRLQDSLKNTVLKNSKMIMWESYKNSQKEKQVILDSGYVFYTRLFNKCYGDHISEVGIFSKKL